jgi:hypothetical protein
MTIIFLDSKKVKQLKNTLNNDAEFKLASRFMSEDVLLEVDSSRCVIRLRDGVVTEVKLNPPADETGSFSIKATAGSWGKLLQPSPPPFFTGLNAGMIRGNLQIMGNIEAIFAFQWAVNRMLDIIRQLQNKQVIVSKGD